MPRPAMPPTPVSSTEIKGQDGTHQLSSMQTTFELPPSAITTNDLSRSSQPTNRSPVSTQSTSPKDRYPVQASETVKSRRRSSAAAQKDSFALPPPPTRSRKIIQMKPRPQEDLEEPPSPAKAPATATKGSSGSGSKKKQPASTSAAGRKIARKTAHSLIERRRRSKMNEEFAVLKGLIPACTGEMHKLAILQASIEYVRYLEDCVSQLKAQRDPSSAAPTPTEFVLPPPASGHDMYGERRDYEDDGSGDVEMTGSEAASPTFTTTTTTNSRSQRPSESPALLAQDYARQRHDSYSSASTTTNDHHNNNRHYSYSAASSSGASPAFGPQSSHSYGYAATNSALTSPALPPQRDLDQEATAALLMLNTDRRGTLSSSGSGGAGRGMSVRDLLSS